MKLTRVLGQVAAVAAVVALAYVVLELGSGEKIGAQRLVGRATPQFAAPLAGSKLTGDANVYTREQAKLAGATAACDVRLRGAFVSCKGLAPRAVLVFWTPGRDECVSQVSEADGLAGGGEAGDGRAAAVAVALRAQPDEVETLARQSGWKLPVVVDRDGAIGVLYGIGACPTSVFVRDGKVTAVRIGLIDKQTLARELRTGGPTG